MKFSRRHFPTDVILTTIRWYLRYKLSYRDIEELIAERGIEVDHSTINRWVVNYAPLLAAQAQHYKRNVGVRWRFDETYIKVRGRWKYHYRRTLRLASQDQGYRQESKLHGKYLP